MGDLPIDPPAAPPQLPRRRAASAPTPDWAPWAAPAALAAGLVLAAVGGLLVDIPALALGVSITAHHVPAGLAIADTAVQDAAFVLAAIFFAQLGARKVRAWQFGLRAPRTGWAAACVLIFLTLVLFLIFSAIWGAAFHATKEKLLEQLGAGESTTLLVLSAALTCVVAPICEEFLFRGFVFGALRNWRGPGPAAIITGLLFGAVHVGSAPGVDLVPLAALGFSLCLLYQYTGSLYPCIGAHALNNSVAFGSLEGWDWQIPVLTVSALATITLLFWALARTGVISAEPANDGSDAFAIAAGG